MKILQIHTHNEKPVFLDMPAPVVSAGEILIRITACGLNFADLLLIRGKYQETPPLPFVPGLEIAGVIEGIGAGVTGFEIGDRVAAFGGYGGLAEYGTYPASHVVKIPASMPDTTAAGFMIAYGTSHLVLSDRANLRAGETLLVTGAAGGVGLTAVEIGKAMGARVIAVARGQDKLDIAQQAGADILIDSSADLRSELRDLGGVDVVYDAVGGDLFQPALRSCRPEGRYITIGFASGDVPQIPANILLVKNLTVIGFYWGGVMKYAPEKVTQSLDTLFQMATRGDIHPAIHHIYPFKETLDALDLLQERKSTGKVVIKIAEG